MSIRFYKLKAVASVVHTLKKEAYSQFPFEYGASQELRVQKLGGYVSSELLR